MNNFLNKFLKNKNTVTILGVIACVIILIVGYNMRINQKTKLVTVYYANQTIQPKTLITEEMVSRTQVPGSFILGSYYRSYDDIVGKYSNYNTMIAEGSIFYHDLLIEESNLPDAILYDVNEGEKVISYPVDIETTYGNSIAPGNKVSIYVKLLDEGKIVYGEFLKDVEVLGVKDSNGKNVFENTEEERTPSFIYFSLPDAKYLLYSALGYIKDYFVDTRIEIVLVPSTVKYDVKDETATKVTSGFLYKYVLQGIKQIDDQQKLYTQLLNEMEQQAAEAKNNSSGTTTTPEKSDTENSTATE